VRKKRIARRRKIGSRLAATIFAGRRADATGKAAKSIAKRGATRRKPFFEASIFGECPRYRSEKRVCGNLEGVVGFSTSCPTVRLWQNFLRSA